MNTNSNLIVLDEVDSTNQFAHELLQNGVRIEEGTAIMSLFQTAGKGQKGNVWESEPRCNMLATVILFPEFLEPTNLYLINQAAALSICATLKEYSEFEFKIKWPNDIMFGENKIAGILIENSIRDKKCTTCIVGAGINLNQASFRTYSPRAISLKMITGKSIDSIQDFTKKWRDVLMDYFELIRRGQDGKIIDSYSKSLFGLGENREFEFDGIRTNGIIKGVTNTGYLLIQTDNGIREFGLKEVRYFFNQEN
jgi:BirA family biotin operon repressor/biotin-[acetyl-CoA-carboxylase] ligase